ncbi:hypothetical protein RND81_11G070300 [Saponaria officinalis]|uniref:Uncharacterized protein n=1 Tax=Saponaria officinalis TaxID=3572 RepID=A0AAW1HJA9_SAPOF
MYLVIFTCVSSDILHVSTPNFEQPPLPSTTNHPTTAHHCCPPLYHRTSPPQPSRARRYHHPCLLRPPEVHLPSTLPPSLTYTGITNQSPNSHHLTLPSAYTHFNATVKSDPNSDAPLPWPPDNADDIPKQPKDAGKELATVVAPRSSSPRLFSHLPSLNSRTPNNHHYH